MKSLVFLLLLVFSTEAFSRQAISSSRYELLSGVRKTKKAEKVWTSRPEQPDYIFGRAPARFLARNFHYIPAGANVLDIGMGEGRNAVFLASKGYNVHGIDNDENIVKKARLLARDYGVRITTQVVDAHNFKPDEELFDAIICFYYVDRDIIKKISSWLKPGGILVFESHTTLHKKMIGQESYVEDFLLKPGELLQLFGSGYHILKYEEPRHQRDFSASIILQKEKVGQANSDVDFSPDSPVKRLP